jgi:hypothetical protein
VALQLSGVACPRAQVLAAGSLGNAAGLDSAAGLPTWSATLQAIKYQRASFHWCFTMFTGVGHSLLGKVLG